ncbi:beta-propeller fold lactonase family protein, partial [Vibrio harveyi]|uniref:beta-propeller fold lactonase family protein n=2 Tax=Pseudomonadota TaxID=1224 RepID=UPI0040695691
AHMMLFDPAGKHVLGTDLGTDRINVFAIEQGKLAPRDRAQLQPGSGPRHLALHPQGKLLYVINELDGTVACHGYDPDTGRVLE